MRPVYLYNSDNYKLSIVNLRERWMPAGADVEWEAKVLRTIVAALLFAFAPVMGVGANQLDATNSKSTTCSPRNAGCASVAQIAANPGNTRVVASPSME